MQPQPAVAPAELAVATAHSPSSSKSSSPRRAPRRINATQPCVVELHQGATRIVHQTDGSIVCEPVETRGRPAPCSPKGLTANKGAEHQLRDRVMWYALDATAIAAGFGAVMGGFLSLMRIMDAEISQSVARTVSNDYSSTGLDVQELVHSVKRSVQGMVVGTLTGAVVAPGTVVLGGLMAAAGVVRMALRPALLGVAVHQGVRWVRRNQLGAATIIRKLQSGDLVKQLEALRRLVARLSASVAFTSQFKRLAGVEVLLGLLERALAAAEAGAAALVGPTAALSARALAELAKQGDVADTVAELDGIPLLVRAVGMGLRGATSPGPASSPAASLAASGVLPARGTEATTKGGDAQQQGSAALLVHAMSALARVTANHAVAQQILTSETGVCGLVVSTLEAATSRSVRGATPAACDELRAHAIALVQALALEPATKAELGAAGGVEALSAAIVMAQPWTLGQANAAAALHSLVRGEPCNQHRLAAVAPAGLSAAINRALLTGTTLTAAGVSPSITPAGSSGSSASGSLPLGSVLCAPVPPQECHAHRADLLALSNVIARHTAPPPDTTTRPAVVVEMPKTGAPTSSRTPFLQRFRLRSARPSAPAAPAVPAAAAAAPTKQGSNASASSLPAAGAASEAPATGVPATATGVAIVDVVPSLEAGKAAAAEGAASPAAGSGEDEEGMGVLLQHLVQQVHKGTEAEAGKASQDSAADEGDAASADHDWEKDLMLPGSPDKADSAVVAEQQAAETSKAAASNA